MLDRALVFDDGARADLAGVDASGHLVLVQVAGLDGDRATLEALDLFALARRAPELFARHLRSTKLVAGREPRVLVIFEPADARLASRLTALALAGLELFELRTVRSASGERSYLLPRSAGAVELPGLEAGPSLERFIESVPAERQELGRSLCDRLARLDDELGTEVGAGSVGWYFREQLLVRLETRGARLRGAVGPRGVLRDIASGRDGDELLEEALSRLVEEVGEARVEEDREDAEATGRREPIALLTAEELDAFRD